MAQLESIIVYTIFHAWPSQRVILCTCYLSLTQQSDIIVYPSVCTMAHSKPDQAIVYIVYVLHHISSGLTLLAGVIVYISVFKAEVGSKLQAR
jgi:hypothetical protein